eukprot:gene13527-biopygen10794
MVIAFRALVTIEANSTYTDPGYFAVSSKCSSELQFNVHPQDDSMTDHGQINEPEHRDNVSHEAENTVPGFQIAFDNLNIQRTARTKATNNTNKRFDMVHGIAIQDRVNVECMDDTEPDYTLSTAKSSLWIMTSDEYGQLQAILQELVKKILCQQMNMNNKSNIVPLGLINKNEMYTEDMISILETYQEYCPSLNGSMRKILCRGDGLTTKRGYDAILACGDAASAEERLEGLALKSENWHEAILRLHANIINYNKSCINNLIYENCGKVDEYGRPFMLEKDHPTTKNLTKRQYDYCRFRQKTGGFSNCKCPIECDNIVYMPRVTQNPWRQSSLNGKMKQELAKTFNLKKSQVNLDFLKQNISHLIVYFNDFTTESISEQSQYTIESLMCDFGGLMGLLIGASTISIVEIVYICLQMLLNKKAKRTGSMETTENELQHHK